MSAPDGAPPCPLARHKSFASVGVSPPNLFRSFPFVIAGLDPAIHAEVTLAQRFPPALCMRRFSMDHRIKSGGDESETVAWHSSGAKARCENESG